MAAGDAGAAPLEQGRARGKRQGQLGFTAKAALPSPRSCNSFRTLKGSEKVIHVSGSRSWIMANLTSKSCQEQVCVCS